MDNTITDNITVVIPSYNEERYIYNTLWSLNKQLSDGVLRVIIADANSTDKTLEYISKADEDFDRLQIEVIKGGLVGFGRNQGANLVNTSHILFMDADSVLNDSDILWRAHKNISNYTIIGCKQKTTTQNWKSKVTWSLFEYFRKILPTSFCTGCFFMISKKDFIKLGRFDETLQNSEDFWLSKNVKKDKFLILNRYIGQDDRRFEKFGYLNFFRIFFLNYFYKNNINWFKKDVGYWKPY